MILIRCLTIPSPVVSNGYTSKWAPECPNVKKLKNSRLDQYDPEQKCVTEMVNITCQKRTLISAAVPCIKAAISLSKNISRPTIPSSLVQLTIVLEYDVRERMWSKCRRTVRQWSGSEWLAEWFSDATSAAAESLGQFSRTHSTSCAPKTTSVEIKWETIKDHSKLQPSSMAKFVLQCTASNSQWLESSYFWHCRGSLSKRFQKQIGQLPVRYEQLKGSGPSTTSTRTSTRNNRTVISVARHGVCFRRMCSRICLNSRLCCDRYNVSLYSFSCINGELIRQSVFRDLSNYWSNAGIIYYI